MAERKPWSTTYTPDIRSTNTGAAAIGGMNNFNQGVLQPYSDMLGNSGNYVAPQLGAISLDFNPVQAAQAVSPLSGAGTALGKVATTPKALGAFGAPSSLLGNIGAGFNIASSLFGMGSDIYNAINNEKALKEQKRINDMQIKELEYVQGARRATQNAFNQIYGG